MLASCQTCLVTPYLTGTRSCFTDTNVIKTLLPGNAFSEISDTVDQALLSGMELYDKLDAEFCTPAYLQKGVKYPSKCSVRYWALKQPICIHVTTHVLTLAITLVLLPATFSAAIIAFQACSN